MKANELMIGDYVLVRSSMKPVNIRTVTPKQVSYRATPYRFSWVSKDLLEPIPVTSEILKEFGFYCNHDDYHRWYHYLPNEDCNLWIEQSRTESHCYMLRGFPAIKVRYVHELQHVLRLCGLNNLADNLKLEECI